MSKKESDSGKLDTKFLWGVASVGIAGVLINLVRHKLVSKDSERVLEIEDRTSTRLRLLDDRVLFLETALNRAFKESEKLKLIGLINQARLEKERIERSRTCDLYTRLTMERCDEALAELEERVELLEETGVVTNFDEIVLEQA